MSAGRFALDVLRALTWRRLLLAQLLALALEVIATRVFLLSQGPASYLWSRVVIEETVALSILVTTLAAEQAVARGARQFPAYAWAIVTASIFAAGAQFLIRRGLGLYTIVDQPGVQDGVRLTQMVVVACDTLTYGVLFILVYLDIGRREQLMRRVRAAELERARSERMVASSQLTALRAGVDAADLLATLAGLEKSFAADAPDADGRLDDLIAALRSKLAPGQGSAPA
ncbi:MAG TPA: hypothetical protein VFJ95_06050 [Gammaproteobacteria bacterium]|nr:hypothetical protein [Gammaproteobacteria bacterium]